MEHYAQFFHMEWYYLRNHICLFVQEADNMGIEKLHIAFFTL